MPHNIILGEYYPVVSILHKMNPTIKTLCVLLSIVSIFCIHTWFTLLCLVLFTLLILFLTNVPFRYYIKTIKFLFPIYIILFVIGFCFKNTILETLLVSFKMTLIAIFVIILLATTTSAKLVRAFTMLLSPLKLFQIDVFSLSTRINFYLHFLPETIREKNRMLNAAISRGYRNHMWGAKEQRMIFRKAKRSVQKKAIYVSNFNREKIRIFDFYLLSLCICILLFVLKKEIIG